MELMFLSMFSNPALLAIAPEDANQDVPLLDSKGQRLQRDSKDIMVPPQYAMNEGLKNFGGSGTLTTIPAKAKASYLQAQGDGRLFVNFTDATDWQIMTGILGTGNFTGRAKYGSNASAQTGQEAVETPTIFDADALACELQEMCAEIIKRNRPARYHHLVPKVRVLDPSRTFMERVFATILNSTPFADDRFFDGMAERLGTPKANFDRIRQVAEEGRQLQQQQAQQTQGGNQDG